jgi:hypothetical protein
MSLYREHGNSLWSLADAAKENEANPLKLFPFLVQKVLTRVGAWRQQCANV